MLFIFLKTLVTIVALAKGCNAVQEWKQEPGRTEVNRGGSVVLPCKIFNKHGTCSWQKDGKPQGMFQNKYEWAGDRAAGDCSVVIMDAGDVDDGEWECQVTASSFTADDALTSRIAEVIIRVAPDPPQLEVAGQPVKSGGNFTFRENHPPEVKCISRYGNPPADIKWFIGDEEIPSSYYEQRNRSESEKVGTWMAASNLDFPFRREHNGQHLRCAAIHLASEETSQEVTLLLEVHYAPTVKIEPQPQGDVEEGIDDLTLQCLMDANPSASAVWRILDDAEVLSYLPQVTFSPVMRKNTATYTCEARNTVGSSEPVPFRVDVRYAVAILQVEPSTQITTTLRNHTLLECIAEGSPPPKYKWIQTLPESGRREVRGHNKSLLLESVTYADQGQYVCEATNVVKGKTIEDTSTPINLQVVGAPQVLRYRAKRMVLVDQGEDANMQVDFCSDPRPSRTTWQWDRIQLQAGNSRGRYFADNLAQDTREDCYTAILRVRSTSAEDSGDYMLNVVNDKGTDSYTVTLQVTGQVETPPLQLVPPSAETAAMSTIIAIVVACLVILILVTLIILYALKTEKCCFAPPGDMKATDMESNKSDAESQKGTNDASINGNTILVPANEKQLQQQLGEKR